MSTPLRRLAQRIRSELVEIEWVIHRLKTGWERVEHSKDEYYLDGVALNLHGFYSGLERLFELIAVHVDGAKPGGERCLPFLLHQTEGTSLQ